MWCSTQNVGSSIRMDPLPSTGDKNWIGVACCLTFVARDVPNNLGERLTRLIWLNVGFQDKQGGGCYYSIPIDIEKDLITVDLDHLLLHFITREQFESTTPHLDISCIEFTASFSQGLGLHIEVKNCGYRWIFEEDLEQLNPQMIGHII